MRINGIKPKSKNTIEEKKNKTKTKMQVAPSGFEPARKLSLAQNVRPCTTGP